VERKSHHAVVKAKIENTPPQKRIKAKRSRSGIVSGYVSSNGSGAETVVTSGISEYGPASSLPVARLPVPSFKKAAIGFVGSITFLYGTAFFLSALL
jgi:hypothetical protein